MADAHIAGPISDMHNPLLNGNHHPSSLITPTSSAPSLSPPRFNFNHGFCSTMSPMYTPQMSISDSYRFVAIDSCFCEQLLNSLSQFNAVLARSHQFNGKFISQPAGTAAAASAAQIRATSASTITVSSEDRWYGTVNISVSHVTTKYSIAVAAVAASGFSLQLISPSESPHVLINVVVAAQHSGCAARASFSHSTLVASAAKLDLFLRPDQPGRLWLAAFAVLHRQLPAERRLLHKRQWQWIWSVPLC